MPGAEKKIGNEKKGRQKIGSRRTNSEPKKGRIKIHVRGWEKILTKKGPQKSCWGQEKIWSEKGSGKLVLGGFPFSAELCCNGENSENNFHDRKGKPPILRFDKFNWTNIGYLPTFRQIKARKILWGSDWINFDKSPLLMQKMVCFPSLSRIKDVWEEKRRLWEMITTLRR